MQIFIGCIFCYAETQYDVDDNDTYHGEDEILRIFEEMSDGSLLSRSIQWS
jgi:hypothetical protein